MTCSHFPENFVALKALLLEIMKFSHYSCIVGIFFGLSDGLLHHSLFLLTLVFA